VFALGENWHNLHHSLPRSARHGVDRGQLDSTARLIRLLEMGGLISDVRWPSAELLGTRRQPTGPRADVVAIDQTIGP
jgi:stearoyl-CoA desaturase (delta-9 desaturase)